MGKQGKQVEEEVLDGMSRDLNMHVLKDAAREAKAQKFTAFYYSKNRRLVTDLGGGKSVSWSDGQVKQLEVSPGLDRHGDILRVVPLSSEIVDGAITDSVGSWQLESEFKEDMKDKTEKERVSDLLKREKIFKKMVESQVVKSHRQENFSGLELESGGENKEKK